MGVNNFGSTGVRKIFFSFQNVPNLIRISGTQEKNAEIFLVFQIIEFAVVVVIVAIPTRRLVVGCQPVNKQS